MHQAGCCTTTTPTLLGGGPAHPRPVCKWPRSSPPCLQVAPTHPPVLNHQPRKQHAAEGRALSAHAAGGGVHQLIHDLPCEGMRALNQKVKELRRWTVVHQGPQVIHDVCLPSCLVGSCQTRGSKSGSKSGSATMRAGAALALAMATTCCFSMRQQQQP